MFHYISSRISHHIPSFRHIPPYQKNGISPKIPTRGGYSRCAGVVFLVVNSNAPCFTGGRVLGTTTLYSM